MGEVIRYRGRWFTAKEIDEVRGIIAAHPDKSRWFLSREICRRWGWTQPNGVLKDMVCRGLLLRLASAGFIELPACRRETPYRLAHRKKPVQVQIEQTPLQSSLADLKPIELVPVRRTVWEDLYRGLIEQARGVELAENHTGWVDWERYSTRQKQRMNLGGLIGEARYSGDLAPFLPLLALGELVHVGKACAFGNGLYRIGG